MEDGTYRARAKTWGLGESGTGKEQVGVYFALLAEGQLGQGITWYGYFTDATYERTVESLRIMGWKGDDLTQLEGLDANEVDLVIKNEEYHGKTHPKVQWVNRPGGLSIKTPLEGDKAKSFAALMKGKIRALDAGNGKKSGVAYQRPEPPPMGDEDIPF